MNHVQIAKQHYVFKKLSTFLHFKYTNSGWDQLGMTNKCCSKVVEKWHIGVSINNGIPPNHPF